MMPDDPAAALVSYSRFLDFRDRRCQRLAGLEPGETRPTADADAMPTAGTTEKVPGEGGRAFGAHATTGVEEA
jgi:hypothetical protein